MSEQVTVKSFGEGSPWQNDITYWPVVFDRNGQDFNCTWGKKGQPPVAGEQVEGEFFQQNGEWRFRKASKPQGGGATSSGGGQNVGRRDWKPESELDPEKVARITRAHCQNMAVRLLAHREDFNAAPKEQRQQAVRAWADWMQKDIETAATTALAKSSLNATETPALRPAAADGEIVDEGGVPY